MRSDNVAGIRPVRETRDRNHVSVPPVYERGRRRYALRMRVPGLTLHARWVSVVGLVAATLASGRAMAIGEQITDVRVLDNQRTEESTVRSIAGVSIGDTLEADTLDRARERLNTAGLFSDVNVWWEPNGA